MSFSVPARRSVQKHESALNCDNKNSVHIIPSLIIQITYFWKKCTALMWAKYQLYLMLAVRACSAVGYRNSSSPRPLSLSTCYLNDALYHIKMLPNKQYCPISVADKVEGIDIVYIFFQNLISRMSQRLIMLKLIIRSNFLCSWEIGVVTGSGAG